MHSPANAEQAVVVARQLERIGYRCTVCDYAANHGFDARRLANHASRATLTLSDGGFDSIPPLSQRAYQAQYGEDLDFAALLGLNVSLAHADQDMGSDLLNPESLFRQKIRGFAARSEELLRAIAPSLVVIQQGTEVLSRMLLAKTIKLGIPWLLNESPFFPGYVLLDPLGQHFIRGHNQIDTDWELQKERTLTAPQTGAMEQFIQGWRDQRLSKYAQPQQNPQSLVQFCNGDARILFVPMQISHDANVFYGLGTFGSLADFYQSLIDALPPNWRIVFKPHPLDQTPRPWRPPADERMYWADGLSIHDLIQSADAVAVFSSNVGLEALLYDKPVIVGGKPCYGGKGLTLDVTRREDLQALIVMSPSHPPNLATRNRFLHYLLNDYLIADGDAAAMRKKMERVTPQDRNSGHARCPFSESDPAIARRRVALLRTAEGLFQAGKSHTDILSSVLSPLAPPALEEPRLAKHHLIPWVARQDTALACAYAFLERLLPKGAHLLDYGCGAGFGTWLLAHAGFRVTGCDQSPGRLAYARQTWQHRRITYTAIAGTNPPETPAGRRFDAVLIIDELGTSYQPEQLLHRLWHQVTEGGVCIGRIARPERAVRPARHCPITLLTMDEVKKCAADMPGIWTTTFFFQSADHMHTAPSMDSEYLWFVLEKKAAGNAQAAWPTTLQNLLPGHFAPASEFSRLGFLHILQRRKQKLLRVLHR